MYKLATFGIINSSSTAREKAYSLWNIYNVEVHESMDIEVVDRMVHTVLDCAVLWP
jgi:hypothetical protein